MNAELSCEKILEHISCTRYSDIPSESIERAKMTLADIFGCIIGGWQDKGSNILAEYAAYMGGKAQATLWGRGIRVPAHQAAFVCASSARSFDYGAVESNAPGTFDKPLHGAETTVPTALAAAESRGATGKELLTALAIGEDLAGRLTGSLAFSLPLDCRGSVNTLAATAIACNIFKLSSDQCRAAIGLALHHLNGVKQGIHFSIGQGFSAQHGIVSAELAERGLYGVYDLVAEADKMIAAMKATFDPAPLLQDLGQIFYSTMTFKPYPCCRATHGAIECGLELLKQGVNADNIENITLRVSPWTSRHLVSRPFCIREYPHTDAVYSIEYALACVLLYGRCSISCYTDSAVTAPEVRQLINRITLTTEGWPVNDDDIFLSTSVDIKTTSGATLSAHIKIPRGHELLSTPVPQDEKYHKFMENLMFGANVAAEVAEQAWDLLMNFEKQPNLDALAKLLY